MRGEKNGKNLFLRHLKSVTQYKSNKFKIK